MSPPRGQPMAPSRNQPMASQLGPSMASPLGMPAVHRPTAAASPSEPSRLAPRQPVPPASRAARGPGIGVHSPIAAPDRSTARSVPPPAYSQATSEAMRAALGEMPASLPTRPNAPVADLAAMGQPVLTALGGVSISVTPAASPPVALGADFGLPPIGLPALRDTEVPPVPAAPPAPIPSVAPLAPIASVAPPAAMVAPPPPPAPAPVIATIGVPAAVVHGPESETTPTTYVPIDAEPAEPPPVAPPGGSVIPLDESKRRRGIRS